MYSAVGHSFDASKLFVDITLDANLSLVTQNIYVNEDAFNNLVNPYNGTVAILQDGETEIVTSTVIFNSAIVITMLAIFGASLVSALWWFLRWRNDSSMEQTMEDVNSGMTKKLYDSKPDTTKP
jgi:hypothetical protein